ncbi:hypothetical protein V6N13_079538 [Hibiscus sabdariffa]|uniref:Uncharacterized protein n=1 Tax=Hibiscus sabdariffa TaxID=183260 RepID=A0ABR2RRQ5_9ROSI
MNVKRALLSTNENTPKYTLKNQPNKQSLSQDRLKDWITFQSLPLRNLQKQILKCNLSVIITVPLTKLGGFLNDFCMKRGKNLSLRQQFP